MGVATQVDVSAGGLHVRHVLHHCLRCFSCEGPFRSELWEAVWQPGGPNLWHLQLPGHYHVCLWRPGDHARDTGEAIHSWKDRNKKSATVGDHSGSRGVISGSTGLTMWLQGLDRTVTLTLYTRASSVYVHPHTLLGANQAWMHACIMTVLCHGPCHRLNSPSLHQRLQLYLKKDTVDTGSGEDVSFGVKLACSDHCKDPCNA